MKTKKPKGRKRPILSKRKFAQIVFLGNLLHRYLHGQANDRERQLADTIDDIAGEPSNAELTDTELREMDQEVYSRLSESIQTTQCERSGVSLLSQTTQPECDSPSRDALTARRFFRPLFRPAITVAASVAIVLTLWVAIYAYMGRPLTYVATNGPLDIQLKDGTCVSLNTGSRLTLHTNFNRSMREVDMQGEIFFSVAKNPEKPFIIHHGDLTTQVCVTSFTITDYDALHRNTVTVATGIVKVSDGRRPVTTLTRDMRLVYDKRSHDVEVQRDVEASNAVGRQKVFRNADLQEIAFRLKLYFGKQLVVEPGALPPDVRLNADFPGAASLFDVMQRIAIIYNVAYSVEGEKVTISRGTP